MLKRTLPAALGLLTVAAVLSPAPLQAAAPDWRNNRLIVPEKVTVGPTDNYQAQVDSSANRLFYTRHQNFLAQIVEQNLTTGASRDLLPPDHDAKDPVLSPDVTRLAVTAFRGNALGSVCLLSLEPDSRPECLTKAGTRAWKPFWVDAGRIGYLREGRGDTELVIHPLVGGKPEVLVSGILSAPAISSQGRYLVYHRRGGRTETGLYVHDLLAKKVHGPLDIDLPGLSSYAVIDDGDGHLYFSHYLNDTNGDQTIDGEDHSVVFRLPLQKVLGAGQPLLPEQLTSVRHNCNFPALGDKALYLTCAYEGSLDTYRLPLSGQVPSHWGEKHLREAHATAASYEARLFLLNTLRYRTGDSGRTMLARLLANHLEMGEQTAALYYAGQLQKMLAADGENMQADFYANLQQFIAMQAASRGQPPGVLTARFRTELEQARKRLKPAPDADNARIFQAWLDYLARRPKKASERLAKNTPQNLPLAHYLHIELERLVHADDPVTLGRSLLSASRDTVINSDARLFYAFEFLKLLLRRETDPAQHLALVEKAAQESDDKRVADLFTNEADLLRLARAEEKSEERELFKTIGARLRSYQNDPMMHRVAHIRAIQLTGLAGKYDFMELMSRNWLTTTGIEMVNFAATAEQYAIINLSRGYGAWSQGDANTALNTFYSVLRQTNDLEALYNLLVLGSHPQADPALTERMNRLYDQLVNEGLLGDNKRYAEALRPLLFNSNPSADELAAAAELLEGLASPGLDTGVKDLLLGSIYHRQLLAGQEKYKYDRELYQRAHYHYMLALDLAYQNPRVQAALLENLGQLHFTVRNHGLSADFYAQRLTLPFLRSEDEIWVRWRTARSLYYSNRTREAAGHAEEALALAESVNHGALPTLRERTAFYHLQTGDHARAAALYGELLNSGSLKGNTRVKAAFNHAYALYKEGRTDEARAAFDALLKQLDDARPQEASNERLAPFQPARLELQSYGFLAHLAPDADNRLRRLTQRIELLEKMESKRLEYGFDEQGRLSQLIQTRLQLAELLEQQGKLPETAATMGEALKTVAAYRDAKGPHNSRPVLQTLYNYLTLAAYHPEAFENEPEGLADLLTATREELVVEPYMPPVNQGHLFKLQLLQALYEATRPTTGDAARLEERLTSLEEDEGWKKLAATRPDWHQELTELAAGIRRVAGRK